MSGAARPPLRVGVDIGGTFTDLVFVRPDGLLDRRKRPSTPADYAQAIVEGIAEYCAEVKLSGVATSAKSCTRPRSPPTRYSSAGARAPGSSRPRAFATCWSCAASAFRSPTTSAGTSRSRWSSARCAWACASAWTRRAACSRRSIATMSIAAIDELQAAGVETVAVCFLHAYRNAGHERAVGARSARALAGRSRVAVIGRAAGDARVRAHQHHRGQCVHRAADRALPRPTARRRWPSATCARRSW